MVANGDAAMNDDQRRTSLIAILQSDQVLHDDGVLLILLLRYSLPRSALKLPNKSTANHRGVSLRTNASVAQATDLTPARPQQHNEQTSSLCEANVHNGRIREYL